MATRRRWSAPGWWAGRWRRQWPSERWPFAAAGRRAAESPWAAGPVSGSSAAGPDPGSADAEMAGCGAAAPAGGGSAAGWAVPG